jgi:uncharacterized protein YbcI
MVTLEDRTPRDTDAEASGNRPLQDISNAMVALYKELFGRGPTKVRSNYAGPDTLLCTLENTFTAAETNLQRMGEHSRLRDMRTFFQYAAADQFIERVETVTGRRVRAFISGIDSNSDVACELFLLEPQDAATEPGPKARSTITRSLPPAQ